MNIILIGILFYISLQLFLGFYISRFIKSENDYLLGGKKLGYLLATFSIFATWFGAESCIGTAGTAYENGLSGVTDPFGYGIVILLVGFIFAVPLYKMNLVTIADFFRNRYSLLTERTIAIIMIPTSILWAAAQIRAFGLILASSSTLTVEISILISAIIVITYTLFGGLLADAWTDLIQGLILIIGLIVLSIIIITKESNIYNLIHSIPTEKISILSTSTNFGFLDLLHTIESWAIPICGSLVAQELLSRVFASRNYKVAKRASITAGAMYILIGLIPLSIGIFGLTLFPELSNPEQILPMIAQKYFNTFLYIIFVGALISAILSTVDSTLLASSALMSHNIILSIYKINDESKKLRVTRLNVLISGVLAYVLATHAEGVYNLVKDASAFGSSGIFVVFLFGLFGKFGNGLSAIISVIIGAITWILTHYIFNLEFGYLISLSLSLVSFTLTAILEKSIYTFAFRVKSIFIK